MGKVKYKHKTPFYAVRVPRDRIGVTTTQRWNNLEIYGSLPTKTASIPLWKLQLAPSLKRKKKVK